MIYKSQSKLFESNRRLSQNRGEVALNIYRRLLLSAEPPAPRAIPSSAFATPISYFLRLSRY